VRSAFPATGQGLETALALSYFAELLDAFAQEGEAEDAVYRLALAVLAAAAGGGDVKALARYLEAWLLKLHGIYPSLDRCAGCDGALPGGGLGYHHPAHGFVCEACGPAGGPSLPPGARDALRALFRVPPAGVGAAAADPALESFHRELIRGHLERDLHSHRILRDVGREMRG
jgi:recombinational DNA repair protein (RecF pathway)